MMPPMLGNAAGSGWVRELRTARRSTMSEGGRRQRERNAKRSRIKMW